MRKLQLPNSVTRAFHKAGFQLKKHSPEILVVSGIVTMVGAGVLACRATLKVNEIVEEHKELVDKIHEATETGVTDAGKEYTPEDGKKELTIAYAQTGMKLAKLYGPAIMIGTFGTVTILAGHNITRKRNVALAAAYTAVDTAFKDYRGRVIERFGKEMDRELRYNIKAKEVEEVVVDEKGKETTVNKTIQVSDMNPTRYSPYAVVFDCGCKGWDDSAEHNKAYLVALQEYFNQKLRIEGYVFLNDVYGELGLPKTKAGQQVGWIYDDKNPIGDNYIDFGIFDIYNEKANDFVNGYEKVIILDFNVDGPIEHILP